MLTERRVANWALLAALFAVALAIRLPNLMLFPRFEDEGPGVMYALEIARGEQLPLTGVRAYTGPLFSYLVAALTFPKTGRFPKTTRGFI